MTFFFSSIQNNLIETTPLKTYNCKIFICGTKENSMKSSVMSLHVHIQKAQCLEIPIALIARVWFLIIRLCCTGFVFRVRQFDMPLQFIVAHKLFLAFHKRTLEFHLAVALLLFVTD